MVRVSRTIFIHANVKFHLNMPVVLLVIAWLQSHRHEQQRRSVGYGTPTAAKEHLRKLAISSFLLAYLLIFWFL